MEMHKIWELSLRAKGPLGSNGRWVLTIETHHFEFIHGERRRRKSNEGTVG